MTRKDYVAIAAAIKAAKADMFAKEPDESHVDLCDGANYAAEHIADTMERDNPRFDRARFLKACGVQS
jgi:hypothetical protein